MERFSIAFNKNIKPSSIKLRRQSDFLDLILVALFSHFLMASLTAFLKLGFYRLDVLVSAKLMGRMLDLYPLLFLTSYFTYYFVGLYLSNGRTLSYYLFNLYTVPNSKRDFDFKTAFLRASVYTIPIGLLGIQPLLGLITYFVFFRRAKFLGQNNPMMDVISDCQVYLNENEDIIDNFTEENQNNVVLLSEFQSKVIHLPYNSLGVQSRNRDDDSDNVIELPTHEYHSSENDKKEVA